MLRIEDLVPSRFPTPVRPELVEGQLFFTPAFAEEEEEERDFDKLSPNGFEVLA